MTFPNGFTDAERSRCSAMPGNYAKLTLDDLTDRGLDVEFLKELLDNLPDGAYVAGGAIESIFRGEKPNDYDIYFSTEQAYFTVINSLGAGNSFFGKYTCKDDLRDGTRRRFIDLSGENQPKLQLITTMLYDGPEHTLSTFDFTASMGAAIKHGTDYDIIVHPAMPLDVARKRLVLNRMTFPASTLRRMIKYTHKGYYACPGSIQKIALATAEMISQDSTSVGPMYID